MKKKISSLEYKLNEILGKDNSNFEPMTIGEMEEEQNKQVVEQLSHMRIKHDET